MLTSYVWLMVSIAAWTFQRLWFVGSRLSAFRSHTPDAGTQGQGERENLLLDGDVVADTSELALDADPVAVVRGRLDRVERRAALGAGVLVVVGEVARAVVVPPRCRVDQPAAVDGPDALGNGVLGVRRCPDLAPAFVVDDLDTTLIHGRFLQGRRAGSSVRLWGGLTQVTIEV